MATTSLPRPTSREEQTGGLRISRYDQVSGMLLSALIVLGVATAMLFFIWLANRQVWSPPAVPVTMLEDVGGGGSGSGPVTGGLGDLEAPSLDDVPAQNAPSIEQAIGSVASIVSSRSADLDVLEGDTTPGSGIGQGEGTGMGDGRGKGPGGPGTSDGVPAYERWEIRMSAASLENYARQLDYFKVELGVAGGGSANVDYVSNLSAAKPSVRVSNPKNEKRLRFLQKSGELRQADRQLAAKAGVPIDGRIVFQFYDQSTYQTLLQLEAVRKGNRRIAEVRKTVFGVKDNGGKYEFFVIDQQYLGS